MGDVVNIARARRARQVGLKADARGRTLCGRGFHKWVVDQRKQFDVKRGQLGTVTRCSRCDITRTTLG